MEYWCIKDGVRRVNVHPVTCQRTKRLGPITVYRDVMGQTYSQRYIRTWDELTAKQKKLAYQDAYQVRRDAAIWDCEKDPSLYSQFEGWIARLVAERDRGISAIERGENVAPPRRVWE